MTAAPDRSPTIRRSAWLRLRLRRTLRRFNKATQRLHSDIHAVGEPQTAGAVRQSSTLRFILQQSLRGLHHARRIESRGDGHAGGDTEAYTLGLILCNGSRNAGIAAGDSLQQRRPAVGDDEVR